jgi:iron complex transport system ATP-binding protein
MAVALALDNVSVGYRAAPVVANVTLDIATGVTCLLGPNGAGKTTFFKSLLGLLPSSAGSIRLFGRPLPDWRRKELAQTIGYVPQAHAALFPFSVQEVVLMGRTPHLAAYRAPSRADEDIARASLDRLGLLALADRAYTELSGGERQLVLIARALAQQPRILVMDEPTASLDYGNQMRVLDQVRALADAGMVVLLSTHHPDHALRVGDAVALLFNGRLYAHGPPRDVLTPEIMRVIYAVDVVIGALPGAAASSIAPRSKEPENGA